MMLLIRAVSTRVTFKTNIPRFGGLLLHLETSIVRLRMTARWPPAKAVLMLSKLRKAVHRACGE